MIDFHTHILPGIDDGSKSVSESISILRLEARQGIDTVFLTPHFYAEENSPVEFLKKRYSAWRQLEEYLWPELPQLRLGAEVQYFEGICSVEDIKHLKIVGTDFLLLEMPFHHWTDRMVEDVIDLNDRDGIQIVLAHIERYQDKTTPDVWQQLRNCGVLMQSNVSFFENWKTRHQALSMLNHGQIHFLGSDCHNMKTRRPNWDGISDKVWNAYKNTLEYQKLQTLDTDGIHLSIL